MRVLTIALLAAAACVVAAPADSASRQSRHAAEIAAGQPSGKPESCIQISQIRESRVLSDSVIDFHMLGNRVYRVTLPNQCPELGFEEAFSYETSLSQLCSTDIITVLHQGGGPRRGASCGLAPFQPITGVHR